MKMFKKLVMSALSLSMAFSSLTLVSATETGRISYSKPETVYVDIMREGERSSLFNDGWKFNLGDVDKAQDVDFNDFSWESVTLPHDYSITQAYTTSGEAESGFLLGGVGWYRKSFTVDSKYQGKTMMLEFDGVYMDATVYVNGKALGTNPYGYSPFAFDISDELVCDGKTQNVIAVRVNHKTPSSRWYSGSGIYRDVYLTVTDPVHVDYNGTTIVADEDALRNNKTVDTEVTTVIVNDSNVDKTVTIKTELAKASSENTVAVKANSKVEVKQNLKVSDYKLWSVDNPNMYEATTTLSVDGKVVDTYKTDYGFRYFNFDRTTGFSLNGEKMKLKGVCMHHDQGALGAVANYSATRRQMEIMKEMGCNAIRVTHNPASEVLIDICNELGLIVIEEMYDGWSASKNGNSNDFGKFFNQTITADNQIVNGKTGMTWAEFSLKEVVNRDKNAPAIIMWSLGNEIQEGVNGDTSKYPQVAENLCTWIEEIDTTRKITNGFNQLGGFLGNSTMKGVAEVITKHGGVIGMNYGDEDTVQNIYNSNSNYLIYGSETASAIHSRGWYSCVGRDDVNLQISDDDGESSRVGWGATASNAWRRTIEYDYNAGEFVWTGFDYLGEPTFWNNIGAGSVSGQGPIPNSSFFGIVDTAGFAKDTYYLYRSLWNENDHTIYVTPHWNGDDIVRNGAGNIDVAVYTDAAKVELYVNGQKFGDTQSATTTTTAAGYTYQKFSNGKYYPTWSVPYTAGEISVKAYDANGKEITDFVGRNVVKTASTPAKLSASLYDNDVVADGRDLIYVEVDVLDKDGNIVPTANNTVSFKVEGEGKLVGVDSGNASDLVGKKGTSKDAFSGKVLAIVQTTNKNGEVKVTASADGLESSTVTITTKPVQSSSTSNKILSYEVSEHAYVEIGSNFTLPANLDVIYANGTSGQEKVTWEKFDASLLNKTGVFSVKGTVGSEKYAVSMTVHVLGNVVAFKNAATVTRLNEAPTLPTSLPVVCSDGTIGESFKVTWDALAPSAYSKEGEIVTVYGTAEVFDETYSVECRVRVDGTKGKSNIAAASDNNDVPTFSNGYMVNGTPSEPSTDAISDRLDRLNNGVKTNGSDTNERWTNWALRNDNPWSYVQLDWANEHTIASIELWHFNDAAAAEAPGNDGIYFETWNAKTNKWERQEESHITIVNYQEGSTPYGFITPTTTSKLRIWMRASGAGRCVGLTEVEVYNHVEEVKPISTLNIQNIVAKEKVAYKDNQKEYVFNITDGIYPTINLDTKEANYALNVIDLGDGRNLVVASDEANTTVKSFYVTFKGVDVNKTELNKVYNETLIDEETAYTAESKTQFEFVQDVVEALLANKDTNQTVVDQLTKELTNAYDKLEAANTNGVLINGENSAVKVVGQSSEATGQEGAGLGSADATLDKNLLTYWHSNYNTSRGMPQYVTYDLGATYDLTTIIFTPRQNGTNGDIFQAKIYVGDTQNNLKLVGTYNFDNNGKTFLDRKDKTIKLDAKGRYVKFEVTKSGGDEANIYCSMSEIAFFGKDEVKEVTYQETLNTIVDWVENFDTSAYSASSVKVVNDLVKEAKALTKVDEKTLTTYSTKLVNAITSLNIETSKPDPKPEYKGYDDVDSDAWYAGMVQEATIKGLMGKDGSTGNNFNPDGKITRGMVATVLYRMAGEPKVTYSDKCSDVKDGLWYSNGIVWASEAKVVSGYANGKFGPDDAIKREDFAIMLRNYANTCGLNTNSKQSLETFKDYKAVSAYAKDAIAWCVENGLMSGSKKGEETYLNPSANTTRAEAAKMFVQLSNLIKK